MKSLARILIGAMLLAYTLPIPGFADEIPAPPGFPPPPGAPTVTASAVSVSATQASPTALTLVGTTTSGNTLSYATTSNPSHGTLGIITGNTVTYTSDSGYVGADSFTYQAIDGATNSSDATVTITIPSATLIVRNGSTIIWTGSAALDTNSASTTDVTATDTSTHTIPANSVLALLYSADASHTEFNITDLQYGTAFTLNCMTVPTSLCSAWRYAVTPSGGALTNPTVGIDSTTLSNGDTGYIYFGPLHRITLSSASLTTGDTLTVTAETYDASSDTFSAETGVTIGLIQGDPVGVYTTATSSASDSNGQAIFTITNAGTYFAGVLEDSYSPYATSTFTTPPAPTPAPAAASGGGGGPILHDSFNVPNARTYIASMQNTDGSFETPEITDWVALALASSVSSDTKDALVSYFISRPVFLTTIKDLSRHAMALEALGINPYSGTAIDFIAPIVAAFDGTQIGDPSSASDDMYATLPLLHAGYQPSESIIASTIAFIISKQAPNGSWQDDIQLTAAALQVLSAVQSLPNTSSARSAGVAYMQTQQQTSNGGYGYHGNADSVSTGLTLQAIAATTGLSWGPNFITPQYFLATQQETDGGVGADTSPAAERILATAHAIPGILGTTWDSLLASFEKPAPVPLQASTTPSQPVAITTEQSVTPTTTETSPTPAPIQEQQNEIEKTAPITPAAEENAIIPVDNQVAAAANTSSNISRWLLALLLLILLAILAALTYRRHTSQSDAKNSN